MLRKDLKGYRSENKVVKFFRSNGIMAQRCTQRSRFGKKDLFGIADVMILIDVGPERG